MQDPDDTYDESTNPSNGWRVPYVAEPAFECPACLERVELTDAIPHILAAHPMSGVALEIRHRLAMEAQR